MQLLVTDFSKVKNELWVFGNNLPDAGIELNRKVTATQRFLTFPSEIVDVNLTSQLATFTTKSGQTYGWGKNTYNELSDQKTLFFANLKKIEHKFGKIQVNLLPESGSPSPRKEGGYFRVQTKDEAKKPERAQNQGIIIKQSLSQRSTTIVLTNDGLYSLGNKLTGLLGYKPPETIVVQTPVKISFERLTQKAIVGVSASSQHVIAWDSSGRLFSWGKNVFGVLGAQNSRKRIDSLQTTPVPVVLMENSQNIAAWAFETSTFVLTSKGRLFYWGK